MAHWRDKPESLAHEFLCDVDIALEKDAPIAIGRSPWRNRRVSYIASGSFSGPRLRGEVCAGGGDWSEGGEGENGAAATLVDVRATWKTQDGAQIYVTYGGRLMIPAKVLPAFRDPARVETLSAADYYFRVLATFETGAPAYAWLNEITAVGVGWRTAAGVQYRMFAIG